MVKQALAQYEAVHGPLARAPGEGTADAGSPLLLPIYPHAGNLTSDLLPSALVDLDPSSAILSYECTQWSYDGHTGLDTEIRGFAAMAVGVPVLAALDGTVVLAHDGEFDMNTSCEGVPNLVIIDHGFGRLCYYAHFKMDTITVEAGDFVRAGQILGLTGSSGCSTSPHLHFEIGDTDVTFDPFAGPCRPGDSGWVEQPALTSEAYVWDFSVTATDPATVPSYPHPKPRDAQIAFSDPKVYLNMVGIRLPDAGSYRYRFFRPDGTLAHETGLLGYPNAQSHWFVGGDIWAELWFHHQGFDIPDLHEIAGTWRATMEIDGAPVLDAPFEVVATRDPGFNRPPRPITASFDPPEPEEQDVLFCRVGDTGPIYLSDPDWDLVRYRYQWIVDGEVVRDATTAGMADALPRLSVPNGSFVTCTVTPSDGKLGGTGDPVTLSVYVTGDCNGNGVPDVQDIVDGTSADCTGNNVPDECEPDCNGNGLADSCDIADGNADDCSGNGIPDSCESDCDDTGLADSCEIDSGISLDCDSDGLPDQCEVDCNANLLPDDCEAVPVLAGSCVEFDGVDDTIELSNPGMNSASRITIEAWIRPEATDGIRIILGHGSPFSKKGTALFIENASYGIVGVNNGVRVAWTSLYAEDLGRWVHLAGVHTGTAWRLYRNGELVAELEDTAGPGVGSAPWAIGSGGGGFSNFFGGGIDEVRLWQVARTQAQIQAAMNTTLTGNEPGLRGYWRLDEGSGILARDSAPHGGTSNGTLLGGPAWKLNEPCIE